MELLRPVFAEAPCHFTLLALVRHRQRTGAISKACMYICGTSAHARWPLRSEEHRDVGSVWACGELHVGREKLRRGWVGAAMNWRSSGRRPSPAQQCFVQKPCSAVQDLPVPLRPLMAAARKFLGDILRKNTSYGRKSARKRPSSVHTSPLQLSFAKKNLHSRDVPHFLKSGNGSILVQHIWHIGMQCTPHRTTGSRPSSHSSTHWEEAFRRQAQTEWAHVRDSQQRWPKSERHMGLGTGVRQRTYQFYKCDGFFWEDASHGCVGWAHSFSCSSSWTS